MNRAVYNGFIKRAQEAGIHPAQASVMFKEATGMDPSQLPADPSQGGGMDPSAGGGGDIDPTGGQGAPDASGGLGVPPEIEQLIQNLPPEVLEQLVQEIEAELAHGGQGGGEEAPVDGGGDPGAGGMDPAALAGGPGKQASEKILAKEAKYVEGFVERALSYGFDRSDAKEMYKKALAIMEPQQSFQKTKTASVNEKQAAHFEGFLTQARAYGISDQEAVDVYRRTFGA